jgi:ribonuclease HII
MGGWMLCGVDEAGRGPVIGPLVVAALAIEDDQDLRDMGVRDSKKLSPARREELAIGISRVAHFEVAIIQPHQIDEETRHISLNELEIRTFAMLINKMRAEEVYVDACEAKERAFTLKLQAHLTYRPKLVCRNAADDLFPVVSAASIIAKVRRDSIIQDIEKEIGQPIGSGYPHDPVTKEFLEKWIKDKRCVPPHTRKCWATTKRAVSLASTSSLDDW